MASTHAKAKDKFRTTLAQPYLAGDGVLTLADGAAASLGAPGANRVWRVTAVTNPGTAQEAILGVFDATGVNIGLDNLTGVTNADGYDDVNLPQGTPIHLRWTAEGLNDVLDALNAAEDAVDAAEADIALKAPLASPVFTGTPSGPTASPGTITTQFATTAFVGAAITALIGAAPGTLDTLGELADAINDDANFAGAVTIALAGKAPTANPTFTGTVTAADAVLNGSLTVSQGINKGAGGFSRLDINSLQSGEPIRFYSVDDIIFRTRVRIGSTSEMASGETAVVINLAYVQEAADDAPPPH